MSRSYRKIIADYRRQYPHEVAVQNGNDWREAYLGRAHYDATKGALVMWFEDGRAVYGFKVADQAAAFRRWVDTCGIDWTKGPRDGPIPDFVQPPERPTVTPDYTGHSGGPLPGGRGTPER